MAREKIFITKSVEKKTINNDYWYSYLEEDNKNVLRVYKQEQLVYEGEAGIGDAFEVIIKGRHNDCVWVTPMIPPRKDWETIAWLLGFSKNERFSNYQKYLAELEAKRESCEKPGYVEAILEGPNFEFCEYCIIGEEYHNLVCWIDENITKEEIIHLIPEYNYPEAYVRNVLKQRFGVTDIEFADALEEF